MKAIVHKDTTITVEGIGSFNTGNFTSDYVARKIPFDKKITFSKRPLKNARRIGLTLLRRGNVGEYALYGRGKHVLLFCIDTLKLVFKNEIPEYIYYK